jgi:Methyltransferase domain
MLRLTARECIRHALHLTGFRPIISAWRQRYKGQDNTHLSLPTLQARFTHIYDRALWKNGDPAMSSSGRGSTLEVTTHVRVALPALLDRLGAETILDLGCGDFTWMSAVPLRQRYIGADIVGDLIAANQRAFGSPQRAFVRIDATTDALPQADAVLCREMLFHLSFEDCRTVVRAIMASGARYLIATTESGTAYNADITSGDVRLLNLRKSPFRFGTPIASILDDRFVGHRSLGVWEVSSLPI